MSKAFDRVSWLFLRLLLLQIELDLQSVKWIMVGVTNASFALLINGSGTSFFNSGRSLRQGCPLAPYLFILVMEGLSRAIIEARRTQKFQNLPFNKQIVLSHLLFVDDILIFCHCNLADCKTLADFLTSFSAATGMIINDRKSAIHLPYANAEYGGLFSNYFHFSQKDLGEGIMYLGFTLKPNNYNIIDWT